MLFQDNKNIRGLTFNRNVALNSGVLFFQKDTAATNDPFAPGGTAVNVSSDPGMLCRGGATLWASAQLQPLLEWRDARSVLTVSVCKLYDRFRVLPQIRLLPCSAVSHSVEALLISVPWRR